MAKSHGSTRSRSSHSRSSGGAKTAAPKREEFFDEGMEETAVAAPPPPPPPAPEPKLDEPETETVVDDETHEKYEQVKRGELHIRDLQKMNVTELHEVAK